MPTIWLIVLYFIVKSNYWKKFFLYLGFIFLTFFLVNLFLVILVMFFPLHILVFNEVSREKKILKLAGLETDGSITIGLQAATIQFAGDASEQQRASI